LSKPGKQQEHQIAHISVKIYFGEYKQMSILYSDSILSYAWEIWTLDYRLKGGKKLLNTEKGFWIIAISTYTILPVRN
jgi:hypothetical protein